MIEEKNYTRDMVLETVREFVKAAYKRRYGTDSNVEISFSDDDELTVCSRKIVVDEDNYYNEVTEIPLDEAKELSEDAEIGDELLIPIDLSTFDRGAVQSAKQRAQQTFKEVQNNRTYKEFKAKEGEIILCIVNSILPNGDIRLNVGGGVEGLLPYKNQSPRETYDQGTEVKCYLEKVENADSAKDPAVNQKGRKQKKDVRIILSRTSPKLIEKLLTIQIPEIYDREVEIVKIVRTAGQRTKVAVKSNSRDIDPVGATVGLKGNRIQSIITEIEGEKIDVVRYSDDPLVFIANALIPAQVRRVVTIDPSTKHVVAIVDDNQLGIAIGQGGVNVKLAKALCDWNIEVKTQDQFNEMEETMEIYRNVDNLFKSDEEIEKERTLSNDEIGIDPDDTPLTDIGLPEALVEKLHNVDIWSIQEFFDYNDDELRDKGLSDEEIGTVRNSVEVTEEEEDGGSFECPICHTELPAGTEVCPNCGAEFEFE